LININDTYMLGEKIIGIIEGFKKKRSETKNKLIDEILLFASENKFSRLEAYYVLIEVFNIEGEEADEITKKNGFWKDVDLTSEFEEACYYEEEIFKR